MFDEDNLYTQTTPVATDPFDSLMAGEPSRNLSNPDSWTFLKNKRTPTELAIQLSDSDDLVDRLASVLSRLECRRAHLAVPGARKRPAEVLQTVVGILDEIAAGCKFDAATDRRAMLALFERAGQLRRDAQRLALATGPSMFGWLRRGSRLSPDRRREVRTILFGTIDVLGTFFASFKQRLEASANEWTQAADLFHAELTTVVYKLKY